MIKMRLLLIALCAFVVTDMLRAKDFETVVLSLDCSAFETSASTEMMEAKDPYNWTAATGMAWTSENCFAQNVTTPTNVAFVGKSVRFGNTETGTGKATTPALNLVAGSGEQLKLIVKLTAGANKTGSMQIKMDNRVLGTITAATDGDSGADKTAFGAKYYTFEYLLTNGTAASTLEFTHSKGENAGSLYVQEIKVVKSSVMLLEMNTSVFTTNATSEMSAIAQSNAHSWTACVGTNLVSEFCYARNMEADATNPYIGKAVRMGGTGGNGSFTLPKMNLAAPEGAKIKLYFELAVADKSLDANLKVLLDGTTEVTSINAFTDGDGGDSGTAFDSKWYEFDVEIKGGTAASDLRFVTSVNSGDKTAMSYLRNLKVYIENEGGVSINRENAEKRENSLSPNPFTNTIYVAAPVQALAIYSLTGVKVAEYGHVTSSVDTSALIPGYYIVQTVDEAGEKSAVRMIKR